MPEVHKKANLRHLQELVLEFGNDFKELWIIW